MKLLDRIALNRLLGLIASFILGILKIFAPKSVEDIDTPKPDRRIWKPRWRKKDE